MRIILLLFIISLLQACSSTTPTPAMRYINRTYSLSDTMYFATVGSMGRESYNLVHPGHQVSIGYTAPSFREYQKNPASRHYSVLGTNSSIDGIVPKGTHFVLVEYSLTPVEGYLNIKILLKNGQFSGKIVSIDEETLLKSMHLKKIKKEVTYWQMGKTYHKEVVVSPFLH